MGYPFRTAPLGGFRRRDVLNYLEKTAQENAQQQKEMQSRLEKREEAHRLLSEQVAERQKQLEALQQERERLEEELEEARNTLVDRGICIQEQRQELAVLYQEKAALQARIEALEPAASAYAALKERTAGIELEAHCRAQHIVDQAEAQTEELHRRVERWLDQVEQEYSGLCAEMEAAVIRAAEQLRTTEQNLSQIRALFSDQKVALAVLSQAYEGMGADKAEFPADQNSNG